MSSKSCSDVLKLATFKRHPAFARKRDKKHIDAANKRASGFVNYVPTGPIWHSDDGKLWLQNISSSTYPELLFHHCDVCSPSFWNQAEVNTYRKLFLDAAKILDPNLFEPDTSDDDHIQNISTLDVGLDLNVSSDNNGLSSVFPGEDQADQAPPQLLTSNDPNLSDAGYLADLIDISHVKRSKFDKSLDQNRIVEILFSEY